MYRKILVPLDGSANSTLALRHATALARDRNARLTLLVVCPIANRSAGLAPLSFPDQFAGCYRVLREAAKSMPSDIGVTTHLVRGDPAAVIIDAVHGDDHDLVVMANSGGGRIRRFLFGSVADRVAADGTFPVLLISKTE